MKRKIIGALCAVAAMSMSSQAAAQGCDIAVLDEIETSWVAAFEAGLMGKMKLGEWTEYEENFQKKSLGSFLDNPAKIDWHRAVKDTATCTVMVESIVLDEGRPRVFATHISNGFFGVGPFKNIVAEEGDWLFDPQATYEYARREDWFVIPEADRGTRDELIAAADAYLDKFNDPSVVIPWGTPCARLEGGIYTGQGLPTDSCDIGVPEGVPMIAREYVVDPSIGAVSVFLKMGTNERADSHMFRVENGKLRFVHTITDCGEMLNCGFDPFEDMLANNPAMQPDLSHLPIIE